MLVMNKVIIIIIIIIINQRFIVRLLLGKIRKQVHNNGLKSTND